MLERAVSYSDARSSLSTAAAAAPDRDGDGDGGCDRLGRAGVAEALATVTAANCVLRMELEAVEVEPLGRWASVEWRALAAPRAGRGDARAHAAASQEVLGNDRITFGPTGRIASVVSVRERFASEL